MDRVACIALHVGDVGACFVAFHALAHQRKARLHQHPRQFIERPGLETHGHVMLECTAAERQADSRLSCRIKMTAALDGLVVRLPERQQ